MIKNKFAAFLAGLALTTMAMADTVTLRENHPDTYVVKKGDTLWDISGKFLRKPWHWPKIWQVNPQVKDPHWIYPGDVLNIVYENGNGRVRLSPSVRSSADDEGIPTVRLEDILPFLSADYVFPTAQDIDGLPYVLGDNFNRKTMADVQGIYVKGALTPGEQYAIYSTPKKFKDPDTGNVLGYRAVLSGVIVANRVMDGNVTECTLIKSVKEINQGEKVVPVAKISGYDAYFPMKPAKVSGNVYVLDNVIGSRYVGKLQTVVISAGKSRGVSNGDVFTITRDGVKISDVGGSVSYVDGGTASDRLISAMSEHSKLPDLEIGHAMVFKTYDNLSLALVMDSSDLIPVGAKLVNADE